MCVRNQEMDKVFQSLSLRIHGFWSSKSIVLVTALRLLRGT